MFARSVVCFILFLAADLRAEASVNGTEHGAAYVTDTIAYPTNAKYDEYAGSAYTTTNTDDEDYSYEVDNYDIEEQYLLIDQEANATVPKDGWFSCDDGFLHLTKDKKCDGFRDCFDCADEIGCDTYGEAFFSCYPPARQTDTSGSESVTPYNLSNPACVPRYKFCDGVSDCLSGRDEAQVGFGFKCKVSRKYRTCLLPTELLNDGKVDCEENTDELETVGARNITSSIELNKVSGSYYRCTDASTSIFHHQVCDGVVDCPDLSDECFCQLPASQSIADVCGSVWQPDAMPPKYYNPECRKCNNGEICMPDAPYSSAANGTINDTANGTMTCLPTSQICNLVDRKLRNEICLPKKIIEPSAIIECISIDGTFRVQKALMCDGRAECLFGVDECDTKCLVGLNATLPTFCDLLNSEAGYKCNVSGGESEATTIVRPCDGIRDCVNGIDEEDCPNRLPCFNDGRPTNDSTLAVRFTYDVTEACDGKRDCTNGADEMTSQCSVVRSRSCAVGQTSGFDCDVTFTSICSAKVNLSLDAAGMTRGNPLMKNLAVQIFLIVLSASGFLGNLFGLVVAVANSISLSRVGGKKHFLALLQESVFYSSVSMAKALFCGCLAYVLLRTNDGSDDACDGFSYGWRTGVGCNVVGSIFIIAIFATWVALAVYVTILGVLACTRKRRAKEGKPVGSPYWGAVTFAILVLIWVPYPTAMVVWTTGVDTHSWVNISSSPNILSGGVMDRGFAENFAASVASASGRILPVNLVFSWDGFVAGVSKSAPLLGLKLLGVFGFYSHSDLCVPLTFLGPGISGYSQADTISSFILLSGVVLIIYSAAGTAVNVLLAGKRRKTTGKRLRKSKTLRFPLFFSAVEFFTWTPIAVAYCVNRYVPGAVSAHSFELLALSSLAINCGILSVSVHVWSRVYYDFGSAATPSDDTSYGESSKILGRERKQSTTSQIEVGPEIKGDKHEASKESELLPDT